MVEPGPCEDVGAEWIQQPMIMDGAGSDNVEPMAEGHETAAEPDGESRPVELSAVADAFTLEELVTELEREPEECQKAYEALESLDIDTRTRIIRRLAEISTGDGVMCLLQLLAASERVETREAALHVHHLLDRKELPFAEMSRGEAEPGNEPGDWNSPGTLAVCSAGQRKSCRSAMILDRVS